MTLMPFGETWPEIAGDAFIAPTATVIGDVVIGAETGIWFQCVLRGDVDKIRIGRRTNIQDGTIIHVSSDGLGCHIGDDVTVGHMALIHACTLEDGSFVGMNATVMDGAVVESGALVAAGALVPPGKIVKKGELWAGTPARLVRRLGQTDLDLMAETAPHYVKLAARYRLQIADQEET
ncbi:MAG TPA: gamma carbonic anhydrase family protein [Rhodospirillales bacterium]|nr:gamma carbonic anhydrase family protein [Rhodospirillales bacterium]